MPGAAPGRPRGRTTPMGCRRLVVGEEGPPGRPQVPLDVVGQHAEKQVHHHLLQRPHSQYDGQELWPYDPSGRHVADTTPAAGEDVLTAS